MKLGKHPPMKLASIFATILFLWIPTHLMPRGISQVATPPPEREINLRGVGVEPPKALKYENSEIFSDLSLLFDDDNLRILFINEGELAVYFSDPVDERTTRGTDPSSSTPSHRMEAFFISLDNGSLVSHQVWQTRRRRFISDTYDSQARILAVRDGFLVHAGNILALYSPKLQKKHEIQFDPSLEYAAIVAPGGDDFFLEQSSPGVPVSSDGVSMVVQGDSEHMPIAHGEWRSSATFEKLRSMNLYPGTAVSVASDAFAWRGAQCLELQRADASKSHVCCGDPCGYGGPKFVSDKELISCYLSGFQVLSIGGESLWGRRAADPEVHLVEGCVPSLDGSRFAIAASWNHRTEFDGTEIPRGSITFIVYDRSRRAKVFNVVVKSEDAYQFALSPSGDRLAILSGTTLFVYRIPS